MGRQVEQIDRKTMHKEKALFHQACREMAGLTEIVARELKVRLMSELEAHRRSHRKSMGSSFGGLALTAMTHTSDRSAGLPERAQIRVEASENKWPMISEMIEDMERKRSSANDGVRARILSLELRLLKEENAMLGDAVRSVVGKAHF